MRAKKILLLVMVFFTLVLIGFSQPATLYPDSTNSREVRSSVSVDLTSSISASSEPSATFNRMEKNPSQKEKKEKDNLSWQTSGSTNQQKLKWMTNANVGKPAENWSASNGVLAAGIEIHVVRDHQVINKW